MLHEVRGGVFLAVRGLGPPCRSGQLTRLWMYPGHVAGLKRLHRSAAITIVLSKDSQQRKQGHGGEGAQMCCISRRREGALLGQVAICRRVVSLVGQSFSGWREVGVISCSIPGVS